MRGVVLDERTGRPIDQGAHYRDYIAGKASLDEILLSSASAGRLPASVLDHLERARAKPRGSGPTFTKQGFNEVLAVDLADGTQILNTTTETITVPDYAFQANDPHVYPGAVFRVTQYFDASFVITTPGTMTMRARWGGVGGTALVSSGAYAPDPTAALANRSGMIQYLITVRTIGAAGSMYTMGTMQLADVDDASATTLQGNLVMWMLPANTPAVVSSLDTTTAKNLSTSAQFSVATATTQLTNHLRILECLN